MNTSLVQAISKRASTIVAAAVLVVVLAAATAAGHLLPSSKGRRIAVVHEGDGTTHMLPLDADDRLVVENDFGTNVIVVRDGSLWMEEADCPRGDCLRQHAISAPGEQIICLPHQLWVVVRVEDDPIEGAPDAHAVVWETPQDGVDLVSR